MARLTERTTIYLPANLKRRAMAEAKPLGISFSELVRRALAQALSRPVKSQE